MNFLKPAFWGNKNHIITILLIPISIIFNFLIILRKSLVKERKFKIPIICIGNIYLGGTGKTPLSILIAKALKSNKRKPAIIKKYYLDQKDEHDMIKRQADGLIVNKSRVKAITEAEEKKYDLVILDDGFQDYSIKKDLNIICFNSKQLIGNGFILPAGPLRESLNSLKNVKIVIINGDKNKEFENKILKISKNIKIFYSKYLPKNIEQFKSKKFFAFAGIGNPDNFFELLYKSSLDIKKKIAFPDHYKFKIKEIQKIEAEAKKNNCELITTEKDYFRLKDYKMKNINYLKVDLIIEKEDEFIQEIVNNV